MTEWMRLGVAVGTLAVASFCAVTAGIDDQNRVDSGRGSRYAFATAAVILVVCIPMLALDGAGTLGPHGSLLLASALASAAVLTSMGRRWPTRTRRRTMAFSPLRLVRIQHGPVTRHDLAREVTAVAAPVRVPVLLVSIAGDRHLVELNQN